MNKIKVIELLNMISKREEVPKKIEFEGEIYEFNKNIHGYWGGKNKDCFRAMVNWRYLNNEVEIIEEEKKIPEKICTNRIINTKDILEFEMIQNKINAEYTYAINEIIDYLKSKGE